MFARIFSLSPAADEVNNEQPVDELFTHLIIVIHPVYTGPSEPTLSLIPNCRIPLSESVYAFQLVLSRSSTHPIRSSKGARVRVRALQENR